MGSKLQYATCPTDSVQSQATSLMVQYVVSHCIFLWHAHACGLFINEIDEIFFEVFVGIQTAMMGREQMQTRRVNREKKVAVAIMNFMAVNELVRHRENRPILNCPRRRAAFLLTRCSVVPPRAVEVACDLGSA